MPQNNKLKFVADRFFRVIDSADSNKSWLIPVFKLYHPPLNSNNGICNCHGTGKQ